MAYICISGCGGYTLRQRGPVVGSVRVLAVLRGIQDVRRYPGSNPGVASTGRSSCLYGSDKFWARDHISLSGKAGHKRRRIMTNAEKFKEVFGFIPSNTSCPVDDDRCDECDECTKCKYDDFWDKEYTGSID